MAGFLEEASEKMSEKGSKGEDFVGEREAVAILYVRGSQGK